MPRSMLCACCGASCGRWEQWPNRDTGYGLCGPCGWWIPNRNPERFKREAEGNGRSVEAEMIALYGIPGVHRPHPQKVIEWVPGKWWVVQVTGTDGSLTPIAGPFPTEQDANTHNR